MLSQHRCRRNSSRLSTTSSTSMCATSWLRLLSCEFSRDVGSSVVASACHLKSGMTIVLYQSPLNVSSCYTVPILIIMILFFISSSALSRFLILVCHVFRLCRFEFSVGTTTQKQPPLGHSSTLRTRSSLTPCPCMSSLVSHRLAAVSFPLPLPDRLICHHRLISAALINSPSLSTHSPSVKFSTLLLLICFRVLIAIASFLDCTVPSQTASSGLTPRRFRTP